MSDLTFLCPCGISHEWPSAEVEQTVYRMVKQYGSHMDLDGAGGHVYRVPREYIAFHGLLLSDLLNLEQFRVAEES